MISNATFNKVLEILKNRKESVLLQDAIESVIDEARVHKRYFLGMLFSILDTSLLGNILDGKSFMCANVSVVRTGKSLQYHPIPYRMIRQVESIMM